MNSRSGNVSGDHPSPTLRGAKHRAPTGARLRHRGRLCAAAALVILWLPIDSAAGQDVLRDYTIDSEHSAVIFKVKNRGISYIYGRFKKVSGHVRTDKMKNPSRLEIAAAVKTQSIDTNSRKRDRILKSKDFFNTTTYKAIRFETKESKRIEANKFELTGEMTLLGHTKPVTVVFELTGEKSMPGGVHRIGGETTFTIKRSEFGMTTMIPGIADEVTLIVSLEAQLKLPPAG